MSQCIDNIFVGQDISHYGMDWNAPLGTNDDHAAMVEVPATENPLNDSDYTELCILFDPTVSTDSHGLQQHPIALQFVANTLY